MTDKIVVSSGNVFEDLGFDPAKAQVMALRSELLVKIAKQIQKQGITQVAAARIFDVSQSRVSDLVKGKAEKFSLDALFMFSAKMGYPLRLIEDAPQRRRAVVKAAAPKPRTELAL